MLFNFLTTEDLKQAIREDFLNQISENENSIVAKAEARAVGYMKDFISHRFSIADAFPFIKEWNSQTEYKKAVETLIVVEGEDTPYLPLYMRDTKSDIVNYCYKNGKFYMALDDNENTDPVQTGQTKWEERDPREQKLIGFAVDITLFYLNQRVRPTKIPGHRVDAYNQAKEWLLMVKDGDITPDLPRYPDKTQSVDTILWGSNPQRSYYY